MQMDFNKVAEEEFFAGCPLCGEETKVKIGKSDISELDRCGACSARFHSFTCSQCETTHLSREKLSGCADCSGMKVGNSLLRLLIPHLRCAWCGSSIPRTQAFLARTTNPLDSLPCSHCNKYSYFNLPRALLFFFLFLVGFFLGVRTLARTYNWQDPSFSVLIFVLVFVWVMPILMGKTFQSRERK